MTAFMKDTCLKNILMFTFSKEQLSVFPEFILFNIHEEAIYLISGYFKQMWQICEPWGIQTA